VALGDFDADGDLDAFVANGELNRIWLNQGGAQAGTMGAYQAGWVQSSSKAQTQGVGLGDLDGDGDLDALVANWNAEDVIWRNDGAGGLSRVALSSDQLYSADVGLGDLDGDGDLDALVTNSGGHPDLVLRNDGNLVFTEVQGLDPAIFVWSLQAVPSYGVALGDYDGDQDLDALVAANQLLVTWRNQDTTLPASGGSVTPASGVTITIPDGAFTDTVVINYIQHPIANTGSLQHVGFFYELDCTYLSTGAAATLQSGQHYTITVTYDQADVPPGVNEAHLALYMLDDFAGWVKEPTSVVDTVANTITATPTHFSLWGVLEAKYVVYLPLVVRGN
jgi:hypothetical protein